MNQKYNGMSLVGFAQLVSSASRSELLEALLEVLPPARHAHREDVPKGGGHTVFWEGIRD